MRGTPGPALTERSRAKQLEMLDIDVRAGAAWLATMRALVERNLSDQDFTAKRMAALKAWERGRKLKQHNLHYKYDLGRRRHGLVERDVKAQLANYQTLVTEATVRRGLVLSPPAPEDDAQAAQACDVARGDAPARTTRQVKATPPAPALRSLVNVDEKSLEMIAGDLPGIDLERATRAEIVDAYALIGVPADAATFYLGILDGTTGS